MICNVVLLRRNGDWLSRASVECDAGVRGVLDFRKANRQHYGNTMQARLLSIRNPEKDLLPVLQYARVLTIKDGGVMLDGQEISFRGVKSKPEHKKQTWWCVIEHELGYAALARMNPRCSTGFPANDDDEPEGGGFRLPVGP